MIKINKIILLIILIALSLKLFTAMLRHKDDPTVSIALKWNVFSENIIFQYEEKEGYLIIFSDENACYGEDLLSNIYEVPTIGYIIIGGIFLFLSIDRNKVFDDKKEE